MNKLHIGLIIVAAVLFRIFPHAPNLVPVGAIALFAGYGIKNKWGIAIPVVIMALSDFFIGYHDTMWFVYGSYIAIAIMGRVFASKLSLPTVVLLSISSSILFYVVTNFGVWLMGTMYTKDVSGLMQSYVYAIPFFRATLVGDVLFNGVIYAGYIHFFRTSKSHNRLI